MEFLQLKIIDYKQNKDNYNDYKSKLVKVKELLKDNQKYENIYKSFELLNNQNSYLNFLLFQNYIEWININFDNYDFDSNKLSSIIANVLIKISDKESNRKDKLYLLFINWLFYLYNEYVKYLYATLNPIYKKINNIRYIIKETYKAILKLYKTNIFNSTHIFNLLDFSIFLIESNFEVKSFSDRLYKAKNYLILQAIFSFLQNSIFILFNDIQNNCTNENENKNFIHKLFIFLEGFQNNSEINSQLNSMILINNNNLIQSFMYKILDKIDIKIMEQYEPKFKNKLLNFFSHFIKYNYKKSKIFNLLLNSLKQSFINLYNFEYNKDKIIHDLFINNFYIKLLKKIFFFDENININNNVTRPLFDSFYYNGFDSQISLNIQNNNFEKSTLFFSFYLLPLKDREQYPLFLIQKDFDGKKNDLLNLYFKKTEDNNLEEYYLYICQGEKENKINNFPKIKSYTTYYLSLCFNLDKLLIYLCSQKEEIFSSEINKDKKLFAINSIS